MRLELSIDDDQHIHLELPTDPLLDLDYRRGETVFVVPKLLNVFDPRNHTFHPLALAPSDAAVASA